ncbi:MAG TPA: DinB family protein [Chloroflexia bacterium]|nr:DinB family protein [Chloroflexia bacterium]
MSTTELNPEVTEIRNNIRSSYDSLMHLLREQVAKLDQPALHQAYIQNEWTVMENVAHIIEFMPYWGNEVKNLVEEPGRNFGRTMQDPGRLKAISEHGKDNLEQALRDLPPSFAALDDVLSNLKDSDLKLTGVHSKFGERSLEWFIDEFITRHLQNHVIQLQTVLEAMP